MATLIHPYSSLLHLTAVNWGFSFEKLSTIQFRMVESHRVDLNSCLDALNLWNWSPKIIDFVLKSLFLKSHWTGETLIYPYSLWLHLTALNWGTLIPPGYIELHWTGETLIHPYSLCLYLTALKWGDPYSPWLYLTALNWGDPYSPLFPQVTLNRIELGRPLFNLIPPCYT